MSQEGKWIRTESKEIIIYLAIGLLFIVVLPFVGGLILQGFAESINTGGKGVILANSAYLQAYLLYLPFIIGALFLVIFAIGRLLVIDQKDHPATQKHASWFTLLSVSLIFSPEENGALFRLFHALGFKKNPMNWSLNLFRCFMYAVLIFGAVGILQVSYPYLNISGVPHLSQQISATSDIIFGSALPSFAENGLLCLIFFFLLGVAAFICSKIFRGSEWGLLAFFLIGFLLICPSMGWTWMMMHGAIYGNDDASLQATFLFGWLGSSLTLLLSCFLFWFIWHFMNNLFIKLGELITQKEDIIFIAIGVWILLALSTGVFEYLAYKYRKWKRIKAEKTIVPE